MKLGPARALPAEQEPVTLASSGPGLLLCLWKVARLRPPPEAETQARPRRADDDDLILIG